MRCWIICDKFVMCAISKLGKIFRGGGLNQVKSGLVGKVTATRKMEEWRKCQRLVCKGRSPALGAIKPGQIAIRAVKIMTDLFVRSAFGGTRLSRPLLGGTRLSGPLRNEG